MLLHMLQMICCLREAELLSSEVTIKATECWYVFLLKMLLKIVIKIRVFIFITHFNANKVTSILKNNE